MSQPRGNVVKLNLNEFLKLVIIFNGSLEQRISVKIYTLSTLYWILFFDTLCFRYRENSSQPSTSFLFQF